MKGVISFIVFATLLVNVVSLELNGVISGPGIRSDVQLPVRYFFIQFVDENTGQKYVARFK